MSRTPACACLALLVTTMLFGQSVKPPLTFEVASIRRSGPDDRRTIIQTQPDGGLRATGFTLKMLLTAAYDVRDFQVTGGPEWVNTDRYDIIAKAERSASTESSSDDPRKMTEAQRKTLEEQVGERLQSLLVDRFQLTLHREAKEQSVYALTIAKGGSKLQNYQDGSGVPGTMRMMGRGQLSGQGVRMLGLTIVLSRQLGRLVIDRTGLKDSFNFKLEWTPDLGQSAGAFDGGPPGANAPPPGSDRPSIFTAVQEQLGLRLEAQKGPVEMIVIDRVEKPSEN